MRLTVEWAHTPGFAWLFRNPGDGHVPFMGYRKIHCGVHRDRELAFYGKLAETMNRLGLNSPLNLYGLCPLPPESYHVTAQDGLFLPGLTGSVRQDWAPLLNALPHSLVRISERVPPDGFAGVVPASGVTFKFQELLNWPGSLVAALAPAGAESETILEAIKERRCGMDRQLRERGREVPKGGYVPHCSLGYWASSDPVKREPVPFEEWGGAFERAMHGLTIRFTDIDLYGFTDMSTYFSGQSLPASFFRLNTLNTDEALLTRGDIKLLVTELYDRFEELAGLPEWCPKGSSGKRPVVVAENLEVAVFNERAKQTRHAHGKGTECYVCLRGSLSIEIEGKRYSLAPGDFVIVHPGSFHEVQTSGEPFLGLVFTANCGGASDRIDA